jgi:hypothetical protein
MLLGLERFACTMRFFSCFFVNSSVIWSICTGATSSFSVVTPSTQSTTDNNIALSAKALDSFGNVATSETRQAQLLPVGSASNQVFSDVITASNQITFSAGIASLTIAVTQVQTITVALKDASGSSQLAQPASFTVAHGMSVFMTPFPEFVHVL